MTVGLLRKFVRERRGVTAVEFALIAMPLFILIMGSIEMGVTMFAKARLEGVMRQAARMAVTGDAIINGANGEKIDAFVIKNAPLMKGARVDIVREFYDRFDQVRQPEKKDTNSVSAPYCWEDINGNRQWDIDPSRSGLGGADDIVNYKVKLSYPALFPLVSKSVTGSGTVSLEAQTTLRNEPFAGGSDMRAKQCCISAAAGNPVTCS